MGRGVCENGSAGLCDAGRFSLEEERMAVAIGTIQTVVGTGEAGYAGDDGRGGRSLAKPMDVTSTRQVISISDGRNHTIRRIDKETGIITTVAGCSRQGYSGDGGPATERQRITCTLCRWIPTAISTSWTG